MASLVRTFPSAQVARSTRPACSRNLAIKVMLGVSGRRSVRAYAVAPPAEAVSISKPSSSYVTTSDKYAIIDVGGVQHLVEEGRWYTCNRLNAAPGDIVSFGRVLALKADGEFHVGQPYVDGVNVEAEIVEDLKSPKVIIYKMKPKKHTRKTVGHRQHLTKCAPPCLLSQLTTKLGLIGFTSEHKLDDPVA
jgi:ribosomal protein L21